MNPFGRVSVCGAISSYNDNVKGNAFKVYTFNQVYV